MARGRDMPGLSAIAMCRLLAEGEYSVLIAVEDSDTARNIVVVCSGSHEKKVNLVRSLGSARRHSG
jgi:hypothetical protein